MNLTYYGHSSFSIDFAGIKLLFDPFITPNELAKDIDVSAIEADYILLSHGHADHVADAIQLAKQTGAKVISNYEIIMWLGREGIENGHPMNHGGAFDFDFGKVRYVNAVHSSALDDGTYLGNPGGFIVSNGQHRFYYSGDTALTMDMQLLPRYGKLDFAILPIGDNFTMGVDDAITASDFIQCNKVFGVHYDTFGYIKINHEEAIEKFSKAGKELILAEIGSTIKIAD
ncbi:metal-dependent hydrolase [Tunicatimonas pelagia]|uniref:metal-dependent hydrolase n=1 Tax=Tunicatimonas pelagia TaxID=931531 RepID=UPI002666F0DA|nr:metal-dependent hydrolase [Tunicatimonas pelagia]WKN43260.1 metal-dependent hydrolase [Tunicatimonas pelagia]